MTSATFVFILLAQVFEIIYSQYPAWSWDTISLWADFGVNNISLLTDYQSEFVANHYKIISLEKCLGEPWNTNISTQYSFYKIASNIRKYASSNKTKIIFYWNIDYCYCDCYDFSSTFYNNKSMWFYDDNGTPIYAGGDTKRPSYDMTQQYVRNWWVHQLINVLDNSFKQNIIVDGIFADGTCSDWYQSTGGKVSLNRTNQYDKGIQLLMDQTKQSLVNLANKYNKSDGFIILGNGLTSYKYPTDQCMSIVPHIDGILIEHFGSFEEVNNVGKINPNDLLMWINYTQSIVNGKYGENKSVYIKSWIGPETTPIDGFGPSWPSGYGVRPSTHIGIQNASLQLLTFPLATYLCGIYNKNVYFNYAWWYDVSQGYIPCPDNVDSCDCPINWYPEFEAKLGKPLSDVVIYDQYKCNRSFENAKVYVDLNDDSSAIIQWM